MSHAGISRRTVYLTDTMTDVRMVEVIAGRGPVAVVHPERLGDRTTNYWPPRAGRAERVSLRGGRLAFVLRAAWWLRRQRGSCDVVLAHDCLTAALAANIGHLVGGPPVVVEMGRPVVEYVRWQRSVRTLPAHLARLLVVSALVALNERLATGIGTASDYCRAQAERRNSLVRTTYLYGVDTEHFTARCSRAEARKALDLPESDPIVMYRSRIAPEKDPETFLSAIAMLRRAGRTLTALYMGGELEEMLHIARSMGVELTARKPADLEEIPLWYVAADVVVQTSHSEGLGISPLEAMAVGTPVVVSATGGLVEVANHGLAGLLVEPGDAGGTAAAIGSLLDDPAKAAEMAERGRQWVEETFRSERSAASWRALLDEAAARKPGRAAKRPDVSRTARPRRPSS